MRPRDWLAASAATSTVMRRDPTIKALRGNSVVAEASAAEVVARLPGPGAVDSARAKVVLASASVAPKRIVGQKKKQGESALSGIDIRTLLYLQQIRHSVPGVVRMFFRLL